ncbi:MAG TPA: hypothetical protein PLY23_01795 [Alphaproteobacteria bacterium]|nr:hypothetical protein [Alphaproteobacteria bacterium]HQS93373.1 hypothetical protein [Alphaproteobacteria bacterium]
MRKRRSHLPPKGRSFRAPQDKSEQLSDWTKRPLTQSQLKYATYDVLYLNEVYPKILLLLEEKALYLKNMISSSL